MHTAIFPAAEDQILIRKAAEPGCWLSNMTPHPIVYEGQKWWHSEALFHALRFASDDSEAREAVREPRSPMKAKMIPKRFRSRQVVATLSEADVENMRLCFALKLDAHGEVLRELIASSDRLIPRWPNEPAFFPTVMRLRWTREKDFLTGSQVHHFVAGHTDTDYSEAEPEKTDHCTVPKVVKKPTNARQSFSSPLGWRHRNPIQRFKIMGRATEKKIALVHDETTTIPLSQETVRQEPSRSVQKQLCRPVLESP